MNFDAPDQWAVDRVFAAIHRKRAFRDQRGRCFWCDREMQRKKRPRGGKLPANQCTTEHLIPASDGGKNDEHNIVAACNHCNNSRGNLPADKWFQRIRHRLQAPHIETILQKFAKLGISVVIGHPEQSAPMSVTPDCPPPKEMAPAP